MRLQEIKKTRIVIASILKPVDDTRMFEKLGQTLAEKAELHIIGYPSESVVKHLTIIFHPLTPFNRLSFERMLKPWKVFKKILEIKPDTVIITTHELLVVGTLAKIFLSCRLMYDVQENYGQNIFYTNAFPKIIRPFIAAYVRCKEWITSPFVNHFLLAERGYEKELNFPGSRKTVIENKTKKVEISTRKKNNGHIHLLFTGTLAETTGVFTAIELAQRLHDEDASIRLTLIGYCSLRSTLEKIKNTLNNKDFIELIGGDRLVPHSEIVGHIQSSDFGIIAYAENPSIINSIPTKLYEYLGYQLPILLVDHTMSWIDRTKPYQAAIPFNLPNLEADDLLNLMRSHSFYISIPTDVFWDSEAEKLKKVVSSLNDCDSPKNQ
jgi:glycosyltransferase involved in cell wall biosynthesis